jgi:kynurenine formamidase
MSTGGVILLYTGRWKRRAASGPWPNSTGFGYHADVAYFVKERGVSFIGCDRPNDVTPTGLPATMGVSIWDNPDFERAVEQSKRLNRYEFLFTSAPLRIDKGTGSPLNPLAIF